MRVRTTIQPDVDLWVNPADLLDMARQGLLLPGHDGQEYQGVIPTAAWPAGNQDKE